MTPAECKFAWRQYNSSAGAGSSRDAVKIGIAGSMTAEPLEPFLGAHLVEKGLFPAVMTAPFNQLPQVCVDHETLLGPNLDAIVLLWRTEDIYMDVLSRSIEDVSARQNLLQEITNLAQAVSQLRRRFGGVLIASTPPYPSIPSFDLRDITHVENAMAVFRAVSGLWRDEMARLDGVRLFDLDGLLVHSGIRHAHDSRTWMLYRQPYTEVFWRDIGEMLARLIAAEKRSPKKCIVLDLDNTLWGGIIGEDGLAGIQLGDDYPGKAYRDFQRHLLALKMRGVVLAVASKNHPEDVYEVFDRHDAMVLSRNDFAVFEIHWNSKVDSIRRIAEKLNLGLDSFVFVDDSPKEIGEVEQRLPEVTCVLVPEELAELPALLAGADLFDSTGVTEEDRRRTDMLVADQFRLQAQAKMPEEDFLKSLELKVDVFSAERQHFSRITQLINKTNQFNLTTIRRTQPEVELLAATKYNLVLGMNVKDRYGDYGLVGVAILIKRNLACLIETLLMSCRVLGRGAEDAFVALLADAARTLECEELRGKYVPSPKNAIVKDLYSRLGFKYDPGVDEWVVRISALADRPGHIQSALRIQLKPAC